VAGSTVISGLGGLCKIKEAKADTSEHPYRYPAEGLNINDTRQLAYYSLKGIAVTGHSGCAFATFHAIISQLADAETNGEVDKYGDFLGPYSQIPTQMMEWGAGGVADYGSICGTLNGACAAIGLICTNDQAKKIITYLLNWAALSPLPTTPDYNVVNNSDIVTSIAGGNLCHMSVTNWCLAAGKASGSIERKERCARLAADVAGTVVKLLNEVLNEDVELAQTSPAEATGCIDCHSSSNSFDEGGFTMGKMDCTTCHIDLGKVGEEGHYLSLIKKPE